jgi:hypothetical protein
MKKTLLCLAIGFSSFYVGFFAQSLFDWKNTIANVRPVAATEICNFDYVQNTNPNLDTTHLYLPVGGNYYYNLPSSKGKHAPDFYIEGGSFFVRRQPSPIDLQPFEFESVSSDDFKFSFVSKEVEGVKYLMEGKMPKEKNNFIIKGILSKYKNGVVIFRRNVVFREAIPEC